MVNKQSLAGNWNQLRGKLKEKWGKLTDDDLRQFSGNVDQLVGRIQTRTGETREAIEDFLDQLTDEGSRVMSEHAAKQSSKAPPRYQNGFPKPCTGLSGCATIVRRSRAASCRERPGESMAMAFGLGFITGAALILLLREVASRAGRRADQSGNIARQIREGFARYLPESLVARRSTQLRDAAMI